MALEIEVAFIWISFTYLLYYWIEHERIRKDLDKILIFTGFATNNILAFGYAYAVAESAAAVGIVKAGFIINVALYLYLFLYSPFEHLVKNIINSFKYTIKRL